MSHGSKKKQVDRQMVDQFLTLFSSSKRIDLKSELRTLLPALIPWLEETDQIRSEYLGCSTSSFESDSGETLLGYCALNPSRSPPYRDFPHQSSGATS